MDLLILKPLKCRNDAITYNDTQNMVEYIYREDNFKNIIDKINQNSAIEDPFIKKLLKLETLDRYSTNYNELYRDIISVGEYKIKN